MRLKLSLLRGGNGTRVNMSQESSCSLSNIPLVVRQQQGLSTRQRRWFVANGSCRVTDGCRRLTSPHTSKSISLDYLINNWVRHSIVRRLLKLAINKGPIPGSGGVAPSGPALR